MTVADHAAGAGIFVVPFVSWAPIHVTTIVATLLCFCLCASACKQDDASDGEENESTVEAEPEEAESTGALALREQPSRGAYVSAFAHEAHRDIQCRTCHSPVQGHQTHGDVTCQACHVVPQSFLAMRRPTELDCLECHHVRQETRSCSECHSAVDSLPVQAVITSIELSTGTPTRSRELPFAHERHAELSCQQCHTRSIHADVAVSCASCHDDHHQPDADCGLCHSSVPADQHPEETHTGCSGTACHADATVNALPPNRSLCLVCHTAQREHEPDGECAECHGIRVWAGQAWPPSEGGAP